MIRLFGRVLVKQNKPLPGLPDLAMNTLKGELNLLILQGSWLAEDPVVEVTAVSASAVIRGGDCATRYRITIAREEQAQEEAGNVRS